MPNPQQPELRRSERGKGEPEGEKARLDAEGQAPPAKGRTGKVPPENQPGPRDGRDEDKPVAG